MTAEHQRRYRERQMALDPAGFRARETRNAAAFRKRNPQKQSAWNAVAKAIRRGALTRPDRCQHCGIECKPEASHSDYERKLEVEWLCRPCHAKKDANK